MRSLAGQVAVITGASSGIGAAVARGLAAAGVRVVLGARRVARLQDLCAEIAAGGGSAQFRATDMRVERQVEALIDAAVEHYGQLDVLVNNAAVGVVRPIADGRIDEWREVLETNVLGTFVACRAALRHMLPRGRGSILNMTSASAHEAWPYLVAYAASKAAIDNFSQGLRAEVAERGVRVMTIEIHNVGGTDFAANFDPAVLPTAIAAWQRRGLLNPNTPMLSPQAVAEAVMFQLAQPDPLSIHALVVRSRAN